MYDWSKTYLCTLNIKGCH